MIKTRQKQKIIKAFGVKYSKQIISILNRAKIKNRNGLPHSQETIRKVVNGIRENEAIENKILAEAEKKLAKK